MHESDTWQEPPGDTVQQYRELERWSRRIFSINKNFVWCWKGALLLNPFYRTELFQMMQSYITHVELIYTNILINLRTRHTWSCVCSNRGFASFLRDFFLWRRPWLYIISTFLITWYSPDSIVAVPHHFSVWLHQLLQLRQPRLQCFTVLQPWLTWTQPAQWN